MLFKAQRTSSIVARDAPSCMSIETDGRCMVMAAVLLALLGWYATGTIDGSLLQGLFLPDSKARMRILRSQ